MNDEEGEERNLAYLFKYFPNKHKGYNYLILF